MKFIYIHIFVQHGGHVHWDVFCSLISGLLPSSPFFILFSSSFVSFDPICWAPWDVTIKVFMALGPSEGALLMCTHSSE